MCNSIKSHLAFCTDIQTECQYSTLVNLNTYHAIINATRIASGVLADLAWACASFQVRTIVSITHHTLTHISSLYLGFHTHLIGQFPQNHSQYISKHLCKFLIYPAALKWPTYTSIKRISSLVSLC